jgi:GMP synthase (glutamine-hydrolysing)
MSIDANLTLCILNCYPKASRDNFDLAGVGHPHELFRDFFRRYTPAASVTTVFIADAGQGLPFGSRPDDYDGFIWTGSDLTIYHDDDPRVTRQIELAQNLFQAGVPSFGSCWGIQMAAVAAGGQVSRNPRGREWGIARGIRKTETGRNSPLLEGKPDTYDGFIMHLDEVTRLPAGAALLSGNDHTRVQALEVRHANGVFWATQYHPEYNLLEMARLIAARAEALVGEGFFESAAAVRAHAEHMRALHRRPADADLRKRLAVGEDILSEAVREQELRNWVDHLVLPEKRARAGRR